MFRSIAGLLCLLGLPFWGQAQTANGRDKQGQPHGFWYGQHEARMGEPAYTEFGSYDHGRKMGLWYKLDETGDVAAIERFANNTLNGESKYFESGKLATVGTYRGLNPDQEWDTLWVVHPVTGDENPVVVATERGSLKHGTWRYYDTQTGRLMREEEYQVDNLIGSKNFSLTGADSAYYRKRTAALPHNRHPNAKASTVSRLIR